jgi:hypothetical protein
MLLFNEKKNTKINQNDAFDQVTALSAFVPDTLYIH